MLYLISQVLLLLALASIISGLIGWLLRAFQSERREQSLTRRLRSSQRSVPSMQRALAAAHYEIDRRENDIHRLRRKIAEIDSDPGNFRQGDFENLNGVHPEDHAHGLVRERAVSGNSNFRDGDFANGRPTSEEEQDRAVEYLNTRIEDTDGKYRADDFAEGYPVSNADHREADKLDALRTAPLTHYRDGDFAHGTPRNAEEQHYADHISHLRDENKAERQAAREHRRILVLELDKANAGLEEAKLEAAQLQDQTNQNGVDMAAYEQALASAHDVIRHQEEQIADLTSQIGAIDNDPQNFREGDLANLDGRSPEERAAELHMARATSGNASYRGSDFANGVPQTEAEKLAAVEYLNTRDEDTDGKYREDDFANGTPTTAAERELSAKIDSMRSEMERHYRDSDFEGGKPNNEEEIKLAANIDVMRAQNKAQRKIAKQRRRELVKQLKSSRGQLATAKSDIQRLEQELNGRPAPEAVTDLEKALTEANDVIDKRETRIVELEDQIQEIDTDANHFRAGDMEHLNGLTPIERAMELAITRATSGNSKFRDQDFAGRVPLSDEEKKLAVEYLATRDEDTDGKYRQADFVNGVPQNAAEMQRAASFDGMRTVLEKLYRDSDFEGDKPETEAELQLAARIDTMRAKNKAYRSAAKKQRKILKQDLANANAEQKLAREAVVELESRLQGIANTNDNLEDIIASLKEDISSKTALQNQAGKKAEDLALTIDKLERELAKATHDGHKKAGDLERELRNVKDELIKAQGEAKSANQSLQAAKTTLAERTADKEKLQEQYAHQKTELALANNQLSERKQEIITLNAAKNREIQELQFALKNQEAASARLEKELENLKRELAGASSSDNDLALKVAFEAQQAAANARVKELEAALQAQASEKTQTWEELKKQLESATQSLQNKDQDLRDANNQLNDLQSNLEDYEAHDSELRNRIEVLESMLAELRLLAGKSMSSRIREIEAMLSAERRKVESLSIESSINEVSARSTPVTKVVTSSMISRSHKKS